jgi:TolA-binding protein
MRPSHLWIISILLFFAMYSWATPPQPSPTPVAPSSQPSHNNSQDVSSSNNIKKPTKSTNKKLLFTKISKEQREQKIKNLKQHHAAFQKAAREYLIEIRAYLQTRYRERLGMIADNYTHRIQELDKLENNRRQSAIKYFVEFVEKYPNNPEHTPDALYRLAELVYEQEYTEYLVRAKQYEDDLKRYDNKEISEEPVAAKKQFPETTKWLLHLADKFPTYRFIADAYYLLGYCKGEEDLHKEAITYFQKIPELLQQKQQNPDAYKHVQITEHLAAEAWIRLGEFYFMDNERERAKQAYSQVLKYPKHPNYDKALYKLAWTHYLLDEFAQAIDRFTQLLEFYMEKKDETGVLRQESIQYIANSLSDEKWGSLDKAIAYLQKIGLQKPYSREILIQLAKNFETQGRWAIAIETNRKLMEIYPKHPDNPQVQQNIVNAYERWEKLNKAMLARAELSSKFGKQSQWLQQNQTNIRAQRQAEKLIGDNIYKAAIYNHTRCQTLREQLEKNKSNEPNQIKKLELETHQNCKMAANSYRDFLNSFPHHKEAYKLTFYLADSLYFIRNYQEAATYFQKVRDWKGEQEFFQESAFSLVDSLIKIVEISCQKGQIKIACEHPEAQQKEQDDAKKDEQKSKQEGSMRRRNIQPIPIPPLQEHLIAARKFFLDQINDPKDTRIPEQMYLMARIYFRYDHLSEARELFWAYIRRFPKHRYSQFAGNMLISSFYREGRDLEMARTMDELKQYQINIKDEGTIRLGIAFRQAEQYEKEGKFAQAAKSYVSIIDKNPKIPNAAEALWNAAHLYSRAQRYGSSLQIYERIVRDYPTWERASQALFYVALNAERYFLFDKAIQKYSQLVNDSNFKTFKQRADALFNLALLLENLQRYEEAARAYIQYANTFREREDTGEMLFRAALIYRRQKQWNQMIQILNDFIKKYDYNNTKAREVMQAYGYIMEAYEEMGRPDPVMMREYQKIIAIYNRLSKHMQPNDIALTREYPAKAAYKLAMYEYNKFIQLKISSTEPKIQVRQRDQKIAAYQNVAKTLNQIVNYTSAPWLLCAMYHIAEGQHRISEAISKAPLPRIPGVRWNEEAKILYQQNMDEQLIQPHEKKAQELYQQTVESSKKLNFENECTNKAYTALNRMDPNFPLPKKDDPQYRFPSLSPLPLIQSLQPPEKNKSKRTPKSTNPPKTAEPSKPSSNSPPDHRSDRDNTNP